MSVSKFSFRIAVTTASVAALMNTNAALAEDARPVLFGGDEDADACSALGQVTGLRRDGDNFLSVRNGPGSGHREVDRLTSGAHVHMCDASGEWLGIVYAPRDAEADCGVSSPLPKRAAYRGSCRSGWVHRRFVTVIAG